jgi:putative Holliday junction resolvase
MRGLRVFVWSFEHWSLISHSNFVIRHLIMRTLAIDLGTRRIGLALSDAGGRWATPHEVLFVTDPAQALEPIAKLIRKEDVRRLVVGLPLNMDGTLGPAAQNTIGWARGLIASLKDQPHIELIFVDERLSSFEAEQRLVDRKRAGEKLTRKRKKQQLDAVAAAGFLQAFLDGKLPAMQVA